MHTHHAVHEAVLAATRTGLLTKVTAIVSGPWLGG